MPTTSKTNIEENNLTVSTAKNSDKEVISQLNNKIEQLEQTVKALINTQPILDKNSLSNKNARISVTSLYDGELNLTDGKMTYTFPSFGTVKQFSEDKVRDIINMNDSFLRSGKFYVNSQEFIENYGLEDLYQNLLVENVLKNVTEYEESEIENMVKRAPVEQQEVLCNILIEKIYNGEDIDSNKLHIVDVACGNKADQTILSRVEAVRKVRDNSDE